MIIDLRDIPEETEFSELLGKDWWYPGPGDDSVLGLDAPLSVRINVSRVGDKYVLHGKMSGGVLVRCDRCIETFHHDLKAEFHVFLVSQKQGSDGEEVELLDEEMEVAFIHGETVDLDEIIKEQIYLSLPMKLICKKECAGLCPACGVNLNEGRCQCDGNSMNPAFAKLKNLRTEGD